MKQAVRVVVTDFGIVRLGPKFDSLYKEAEGFLVYGKRTKRYKYGKQRMAEIDSAVSVLAQAYFASGEDFEVTP